MVPEGQALLGLVVGEDEETLTVRVRKGSVPPVFEDGDTFYLLAFLKPDAAGDGYDAHRPWESA